MAGNDDPCLHFNDFETSMNTSWKESQMEEYSYDITLACEDKQIKAHKIVIILSSPVLRNILKFDHNHHPLIYLTRVKGKDLQNILNFMYQGIVNVTEEDLNSFLEVAEILKIKGLSEGNVMELISNEEHCLQKTNVNQSAKIIERIDTNDTTQDEIAKVLKIKGFSKGNVKGFVSNEENCLQIENADQSPKIVKKIEKNKTIQDEMTKVLNIRTLSEENMMDLASNDEHSLKIVDVHQSPKIMKRIWYEDSKIRVQMTNVNQSQKLIKTNKKNETILDKSNQSSGFNTQTVKTDDSIGTLLPFEKEITTKQELYEDSKENIVSTFGRKQYNCKKCDKTYSGQPGLYHHTKTIHEGKRYQCDHCKYKAAFMSDLQRHVKCIHEGVRYPCDQCNHTSGDKSNLTQHVKSIHGEVRYSCEQCDYKSKDKKSLARHISSVHEGVRYLCDQCEYRATQKSNLSYHQLRYHC